MKGARQGILSLTIKDKGALYAAYMPFVKNGGLFIPTNKAYQLQQSENLGGTAQWTDFGSALPGVDGVLTQSVGLAAGASHFFRVQAR